MVLGLMGSVALSRRDGIMVWLLRALRVVRNRPLVALLKGTLLTEDSGNMPSLLGLALGRPWCLTRPSTALRSTMISRCTCSTIRSSRSSRPSPDGNPARLMLPEWLWRPAAKLLMLRNVVAVCSCGVLEAGARKLVASTKLPDDSLVSSPPPAASLGGVGPEVPLLPASLPSSCNCFSTLATMADRLVSSSPPSSSPPSLPPLASIGRRMCKKGSMLLCRASCIAFMVDSTSRMSSALFCRNTKACFFFTFLYTSPMRVISMLSRTTISRKL
mmetsp:Transcript_16708/g.36137  ORF Transcript_16708/g.36137 Transcript_16708/m.36137 type:complete len:273 (-) Transcript_16708:2435-3253(-)